MVKKLRHKLMMGVIPLIRAFKHKDEWVRELESEKRAVKKALKAERFDFKEIKRDGRIIYCWRRDGHIVEYNCVNRKVTRCEHEDGALIHRRCVVGEGIKKLLYELSLLLVTDSEVEACDVALYEHNRSIAKEAERVRELLNAHGIEWSELSPISEGGCVFVCIRPSDRVQIYYNFTNGMIFRYAGEDFYTFGGKGRYGLIEVLQR